MPTNEIVNNTSGGKQFAVVAPVANVNAGDGNVYYQPGTPGSFDNQEILNNQETGAFVNLVPGNNASGQLANQLEIYDSIGKGLQRKGVMPNFSPILTRDTGGIFSPDNNVFSGINFGGAVASKVATTALVTSLASETVTQDGVVLTAGQKLLIKNGAIPVVFNGAECATTAALPANVYANGTLGVGATLTMSAVGIVHVDGHAVVLNDLVLVQNEAVAAHNGLYVCSTEGTAGVAGIFTRDTSMENIATFTYGGSCLITAGTVNAGLTFLLSSVMTTVGTTAVSFALLTSEAGSLITHAFDGLYTVGTVGGGLAPLTRTTGYTTAAELQGLVVTPTNGTANGGKTFLQLQTVIGAVGITPLDFENYAEYLPTALTSPVDNIQSSDVSAYFSL